MLNDFLTQEIGRLHVETAAEHKDRHVGLDVDIDNIRKLGHINNPAKLDIFPPC